MTILGNNPSKIFLKYCMDLKRVFSWTKWRSSKPSSTPPTLRLALSPIFKNFRDLEWAITQLTILLVHAPPDPIFPPP